MGLITNYTLDKKFIDYATRRIIVDALEGDFISDTEKDFFETVSSFSLGQFIQNDDTIIMLSPIGELFRFDTTICLEENEEEIVFASWLSPGIFAGKLRLVKDGLSDTLRSHQCYIEPEDTALDVRRISFVTTPVDRDDTPMTPGENINDIDDHWY